MNLASWFSGKLKLNKSFKSSRKVLTKFIAVDKWCYFDLLPTIGALFSCIEKPILDAGLAIKLRTVRADMCLISLIGADETSENVDKW